MEKIKLPQEALAASADTGAIRVTNHSKHYEIYHTSCDWLKQCGLPSLQKMTMIKLSQGYC
jgi:hypothetical protein